MLVKSKSKEQRGQITLTNHQLSVTNHQLPITSYQLPITNIKFQTLPLLSVIFIISLFLCIPITSFASPFAGGTGEPNDPYQLVTAEQLLAVVNDYNAHYILSADIDLSGQTFSSAPISLFSVRFNGDGHRIINLTIQGYRGLGLFGCITDTAEVQSLGIVDANVVGTGHNIGLLAGANQGSITACYSIGSVSGDRSVGGLLGSNYEGGSVTHSYSTGSVSGDGSVGGLVGHNYNGGSITQSYSTGSVSGHSYVGGLVGTNYEGSITQSYSNGVVSGEGKFVGGLIGSNEGSIIQCLWDTETSGQSISAGGEGLTTDELFKLKTYINRRWDFIGESTNGLHEAWQMPRHEGYPVLAVFHRYEPNALAGEGTNQSPYQIATAFELAAILYYGSHASYVLTSDIDLTGILWSVSPIGYFNGHLNGQGYVIRNLTIEGEGYLGLFGRIGKEATIESLGITDANVAGTDDYIGLLAGRNQGAITACYSRGSLSGDRYVGGLVGYNKGIIISSYSSGAVSGEGNYIGGLAGYNHGSIFSNYSSSSVSGNAYIGGLLGDNDYYSIITSSYSSGSVSGHWYVGGLVGYNRVGTISLSFWDIETSGLTESAGGTGLNTTEMMDPEILGLNGLAEDPNWILDAYNDYPRLTWQGTPGTTVKAPLIDWLNGQGTLEEPYQIETMSQLQRISKAGALMDQCFQLVNDLDLTDIIWSQAVIPHFSGQFYGQGHVIRNLCIQGTSYLGLFGQLDSGGIISNVVLQDVNIDGKSDYIGGLVGYNKGIITSSYNSGSVSGGRDIGGLVGYNIGNITSSYSNVSVSGHGDVGGLVGTNLEIVTLNYSSGSVTGYGFVGGLVGNNYYGSIFSSYSSGLVNGKGNFIGGLVGRLNNGSIFSSFWDMEASGLTKSAGGTGLTTAKMKDINTYLDNGWDFVDETTNGTSNFWHIQTGTYPNLVVFTGMIPFEPNGIGTLDDPYEITDANELGSIWYRPEAHYRLANDIDLSGITWSAAVVPWLVGSLNGNGHVISHLNIQGAGYLGLLGELASGGIISNVGLEDVNIDGISNYIGGLVGYNRGNIISSYSSGSVSGDRVGGLVGYNSGSVTASYSSSAVSGDVDIGGLVGYNDRASITSSYSTGLVSGDKHVGGLVGRDYEGSIKSSYWDTQTFGLIISAGGEGLTTAEMQNINTYLDAGWDFNDVWMICEDVYPRLLWEEYTCSPY